MGDSDVTGSDDLAAFGHGFLGRDIPIVAADQIPKNFKMCIANTDPHGMSGHHWVALVGRKDGEIDAYDSFGRDIVIGDIKINQSDKDREQPMKAEDCGQRCLAWLFCYLHFGRNFAMKI